MSLIEGLATSPGLLLFSGIVLGLAVGSFLNVLILRLPRMLEIEWRRDAKEILAETSAELDGEQLGLARPASHCPGCKQPLRAWQNIPVISWLLLRGRCANCGTRISLQYPLVELAAGALAALCVWRFGWSLELAAALVFCWALLALTVIDLRTQLLPDILTLPLLWLGLLVNLDGRFAPLSSAVLGAAVGYGAFWLMFQTFRLLTGKEGMGFGDFKLLAAICAWLGIGALLPVILISSILGAGVGILMLLSGRLSRDKPMPFGPYLAVAGLLMLFQGEAIVRLWLGAAGAAAGG